MTFSQNICYLCRKIAALKIFLLTKYEKSVKVNLYLDFFEHYYSQKLYIYENDIFKHCQDVVCLRLCGCAELRSDLDGGYWLCHFNGVSGFRNCGVSRVG